jgi:hypothetical protein
MSNALSDAAVGHLSAVIEETATADVITNTDTQKKIVVHGLKLNVDAALTVNFTDGSGGTAIEGTQDYAANGGFTESVTPPEFLFECSAGADLELTISGTGTVAGTIRYRLVAVENSAGAGFGPTSTP